MNKNFKNAIIFTSGLSFGFVIGSSVIIIKALKSETVREFLSKILASKIDKVLFGESSVRNCRRTGASYVNYHRTGASYVNYYDHHNRDKSIENGANVIVFDNRAEAENVKQQMLDIIEKYGFASVADLYDLSGLTSHYTDNLYGWTVVSKKFKIKRYRDGYILETSKASPIEKRS